eukprot:2323207-Rhodomonas_salina.1
MRLVSAGLRVASAKADSGTDQAMSAVRNTKCMIACKFPHFPRHSHVMATLWSRYVAVRTLRSRVCACPLRDGYRGTTGLGRRVPGLGSRVQG